MTTWKKEPQIKPEDLHIGCPICSTACLEAPLNMHICIGFGDAYVTKDGKQIYNGELDAREGKEPKTVGDIEKMAQEDPDHDWRIVIFGPLHDETFQRHGKNKWVCIESNQGFA